MQSTKTLTGLGTLGCCQDTDVAKYARFCVAINLQKVALILRKVWAFSVAADMATHQRFIQFSRTAVKSVSYQLSQLRSSIVSAQSTQI